MNKFLIVVIALILSYAVAFRVGSTLETELEHGKPDKCKDCKEKLEICLKKCDKQCWDPCDDDCDKKCKKDCYDDYKDCVKGIKRGVELPE